MATNQVPRRKPTGKKPVRKTSSSVKQPAPKPVTVSKVNANTSSTTNSISQLSKQVEIRDKEIAMLKKQIISQEKKLSGIKAIAVHMAQMASRNNAIKTGQVLDWGTRIMNIINGR